MKMSIGDFECIVGEESLDWDEVEREHTSEDDGRVPHVPFGFINSQWEELKAQRTDTSELRTFTNDPEDWEMMMGRSGYVLIDNGKIIDSITCAMN